MGLSLASWRSVCNIMSPVREVYPSGTGWRREVISIDSCLDHQCSLMSA